MKYIVKCKSIIPFDKLHPLDQKEGPPDRTEWACATESQALDAFHSTHPIKVLDNFEITVVHYLEEAPGSLETWSVDEVAECLEGISMDTYQELWAALAASEQNGTMKPSGGDGSDGTFEEPVITSGEYGSDLVAAWPKLSDKAKLDIHNAAEARETR